MSPPASNPRPILHTDSLQQLNLSFSKLLSDHKAGATAPQRRNLSLAAAAKIAALQLFVQTQPIGLNSF